VHSARKTVGPRPAGVIAGAVVMVVAAALITWKVIAQITAGPEWDTYAFLANAAEFAGKGFGYTELHRPPVLSFLTSLVFRAVGLRIEAIQWVDGALTLSGIGAVYLLMRRRFDPVFSAAGALMLLAVAPLWSFLGVGYTDTAAVALCAWLLLVLIKATEENPYWFLAAGPLFVAATMTRYTALLFAFACIVWLGFRASFFRHAWTLLISAALGAALYLPAALYYLRNFGEAFFPFIVAFGFTEAVAVPGGEVTSDSAANYLLRAPVLLGPPAIAILTVFVLLVAFSAILTVLGSHVERTRPGFRRFVFAALWVAPAVFAQMRGGMVLRQMTIPVAVFGLWRVFAERDPRNRTTALAALDATMVAWLAIYVDFHGHQQFLVARYFIAMAVPLVYLLVRGWDLAAARLADALAADNREKSAVVRWVVTGFFVLTVALGLAVTVQSTERTPGEYAAAAKDTSAWLASQPGASDSTVVSDIWPYTAWYLKQHVRPMSSYETSAAYGHELDKSGADYYVTIRPRRFPEFEQGFTARPVTVLARSAEPSSTIPSVQYLGKSWDNYLEQLTDFDFNLMSTAGRYGWEGSAFLDGLTADELAQHDAVAIYGVKWHKRADGERALQSYVEQGGSVVFDGSQNLDDPAYQMGGTVAFDSIVRQETMPADAQVEVDPTFARKHALDPVVASPFINEGGGAWSGASYVERPGTASLKTLATAGGEPVVSYRDVGKGRVYFIGYNLAWHAFNKDNTTEAALIRAVFADAIQHSKAAKESK